MKVTGWRIVQSNHSRAAFSGKGARIYGGRWNSKGTAMVYVAGSCSLAALEILVHLQDPEFLGEYIATEVSFDSRLVQTLDKATLPTNWRDDPGPPELKALGDFWVNEKLSAVMKVPNTIIETEFNYLLNPAHADFDKIKIGFGRPFSFDPRLIN